MSYVGHSLSLVTVHGHSRKCPAEEGKIQMGKEIGESFRHVPMLGTSSAWGLVLFSMARLWFFWGLIHTCRFCRMLHRSIWSGKRVDEGLGCRDHIKLIMMPITKEEGKNTLENECVASFVWPWPCIYFPFLVAYFVLESVSTMPWS